MVSEANWKTAVVANVTGLAEAFGRSLSAAGFRAFEVGLEGLTAEQIHRATAQALRTCKFMPAPAELREMSGELRIDDRAERAWLALEESLSRHGAYKTLAFDDPVIHAVVRSLGGLQAIVELEADQVPFLRARFLKAYVALARAGVNGEAAAPLIGFFDSQNSIAGYAPKALVHVRTGLPQLPSSRPAAIPQRATALAGIAVEIKRP